MIKACIRVAFTPVLGALQAVKILGKTEFNEPSLTNTFCFIIIMSDDDDDDDDDDDNDDVNDDDDDIDDDDDDDDDDDGKYNITNDD